MMIFVIERVSGSETAAGCMHLMELLPYYNTRIYYEGGKKFYSNCKCDQERKRYVQTGSHVVSERESERQRKENLEKVCFALLVCVNAWFLKSFLICLFTWLCPSCAFNACAMCSCCASTDDDHHLMIFDGGRKKQNCTWILMPSQKVSKRARKVQRKKNHNSIVMVTTSLCTSIQVIIMIIYTLFVVCCIASFMKAYQDK